MGIVEKTFLFGLCKTFWLLTLLAVIDIKITVDLIPNLVLLQIDCFFPDSGSWFSYFRYSSYLNFLQLVASTCL